MLRSLNQPLRALHVHVLGDHELGLRALHVVAVAPRVAGHRARVGQRQPSARSSSRSRGLGRVDVERHLEAARRRASRQLGELAELVHAQAVGLALVLDRAERPAPARDAGERASPAAACAGQCSSTTGCGVVIHSMPPVGIAQSGPPMRSPIVT